MTVGMLVWGAAPASAGGPTSAFLVSPATGEAAGLYYSDREYTQLDSLLQAGTLGAPPKGVMADRRITVTWLIHDTSPWRIDGIFPVVGGGDVWVHRSMSLTESSKDSWHRAPNPERLRALLKDLGMLGKGDGGEDLTAFSLREMYTSTGEDGTATETGASTAASAAAPAPRPSAASGTSEDTDWWWALPGGAAGAVLALTLRPLATRLPLGRRKGEPGPRQELLDA
ncbi:hypothetical protein H4N64_07185 [Streptomyces sp. PSKA01]|uniref:Uncharacterized protein n=1 Tax=Streptomyces cupreus TaxID=2759956 RepID=A0A7X1J461_9ACTN|nr:hypothetical protein [Streptomyces cupreus]